MTRRIVLVALLLLVGMLTWYVGSLLSADAQGLALGLVLGALAGMPAAILVLFLARRSTDAAPVTEAQNYRPQTEDDAPSAAWPSSFAAMGISGDEEEFFPEKAWGKVRNG